MKIYEDTQSEMQNGEVWIEIILWMLSSQIHDKDDLYKVLSCASLLYIN